MWQAEIIDKQKQLQVIRVVVLFTNGVDKFEADYYLEGQTSGWLDDTILGKLKTLNTIENLDKDIQVGKIYTTS